MSTRKKQARHIKLQRLKELQNILVTLKYTLQVGTSLESKYSDKDEKKVDFYLVKFIEFPAICPTNFVY